MNLPTTPAEILAELERLGLPDSKIEIDAGLPRSFLYKARKGKCNSMRAAATWTKLRAWLQARHGECPPSREAPAGTTGAPCEPPQPPKPAAQLDGCEPVSGRSASDLCDEIARRNAPTGYVFVGYDLHERFPRSRPIYRPIADAPGHRPESAT